MKAAPTMLQSLPPPTTFSVPAQAPPPSLLQAQLSAASLAPLLQNPPQPLLPQPPPKGTVLVSGIYLAFACKALWTTSNDECYFCCCFGTTFEHRIVCVVSKCIILVIARSVSRGSPPASSENDGTAAACPKNWASASFPHSQWSRPWAHPQN